MFTKAWWFLAVTYGLLWAGLLLEPSWFYAAIATCYLQALIFGLEDKSFLSLSCQVRYAMAAIFSAGLLEPLRWVYWIVLAGLTARLTLNYCLLARLMSLMPWNLKEPFSMALFKRKIFSAPTKGSVLSL